MTTMCFVGFPILLHLSQFIVLTIVPLYWGLGSIPVQILFWFAAIEFFPLFIEGTPAYGTRGSYAGWKLGFLLGHMLIWSVWYFYPIGLPAIVA